LAVLVIFVFVTVINAGVIVAFVALFPIVIVVLFAKNPTELDYD
jgi:hypothetical protein